MNLRRIPKFTQQIGACTDSADTPTVEDDVMPYDSSIVKQLTLRGLPGRAAKYDADAHESAAV
jgi:hypothetical protein